MTAAAAAGTVTTGVTNGVIGVGVTAYRTEVLTAAMARGRTIRPRLAQRSSTMGLGLGLPILSYMRPEPSVDPERAHPSGKLALQHLHAGVIERVGSCRGG